MRKEGRVENFRGNIFSRRKLREEINDELFWGHDIDDHSTIDLPTMLDFVLQQTKREKLIYIGHSMGATSLFILCDTKPEYNDKIHQAYLLAPVGDLGKINGLPKNILKSAELFLKVLEMLNIYTLFFPRLIPGWTMIGILVFQISGYNSVTSDIDCDIDKVKDILKFSPSGSTTKSILQYLKCHDKKKLVSSDAKNQAVTSEYSLAKTTIPITILWAQRDVYAGAENMAQMKKDLPNIVGMYQMNDSYGHLDFIWEAKPATKILDELIIQRQLPQVHDLPEADETYNQPTNAPKTSVWGILSAAWKEYCKSEAQEDDE
jgi:lysosomal acid lipase/cholesteryl ester hydrolase